MKKVSIITICYNSEKTIRHTIESVLSQDYPDVEYIVIDGCSNDNTIKIVNEYRNKIAKVVCEPDQGIYDAMNKGVANATGDIVGILNSDDFFENSFVISDVLKQFADNPSASLVFGDVVYVESSNIDRIKRFYSSVNFKAWKLRFGWMPPHPATFIKKAVYERVGIYSIDYKISSDYEYFVRMLLIHKLSYSRVDKVLVRMRVGGVSTSGIKSILLLNSEIVKACRRNGIYTNLFILSWKAPLKLLEVFKRPKN